MYLPAPCSLERPSSSLSAATPSLIAEINTQQIRTPFSASHLSTLYSPIMSAEIHPASIPSNARASSSFSSSSSSSHLVPSSNPILAFLLRLNALESLLSGSSSSPFISEDHHEQSSSGSKNRIRTGGASASGIAIEEHEQDQDIQSDGRDGRTIRQRVIEIEETLRNAILDSGHEGLKRFLNQCEHRTEIVHHQGKRWNEKLMLVMLSPSVSSSRLQ